MKVRIIISGSRNYENYEEFSKTVDDFLYDFKKNILAENIDNSDSFDSAENWFNKNYSFEIITGMAVGTDLMAIKYCYSNDHREIKLVPFEPKFWIHGEMAGEIRNKEMAEYAIKGDLYYLYAFWNGNNGGTKHMIDTAALYNIPTYIKRIDEVINV
jgi:hypothetical protein